MLINITPDNYVSEVAGSSIPVLLYFKAPWCTSCKVITPIIEQLSEDRLDIKFAQVDIDAHQDLAVQFHITTVPTFILTFKGGVQDHRVGVQSRYEIDKMLNQFFDSND